MNADFRTIFFSFQPKPAKGARRAPPTFAIFHSELPTGGFQTRPYSGLFNPFRIFLRTPN
jgi:hypothetical protein